MPQQVRNIDPILPLFAGKTLSLVLPSGRKVTIRETNGDDEELLSSLESAQDGSNMYNFLSAIIVSKNENDEKIMPEDLQKWLINDRIVLMYKSRIFNHGYDLRFRATCQEEKCQHEDTYFQDLKIWDNDLSMPEKNTSLKAIRRYPQGDKREIEFVISSGKKLKYTLVNGVLEKAALELKDMTQNSPLIIRELQVENKGAWLPVKHFAGFGSKEMMEIRTNIRTNDKQFDPMVNFTCANPVCRKDYSVSLFSIGNFFYPEETI